MTRLDPCAYATAEAQNVLGRLNQLSKQKYVSPGLIAFVYAGLRDKDQGFESLQKAYVDKSVGSSTSVNVSPVWDPLRSDPRFADLLRRTNLQP
jgi:hypothetical protein